MGVTSLGRHTRPACTQGFTRSLKLCEECRFNSCVRVFFIPWGHVSNHAQIWAFVTSISHMGEMRDSDWSRPNLLRSDWLLPSVALCTTHVIYTKPGLNSNPGFIFICLRSSSRVIFSILYRASIHQIVEKKN